MSQNPDEKREYWRERAICRLTSMHKQVEFDMSDVFNSLKWVGLEVKPVMKQTDKVRDELKKLFDLILKAEPIKAGGGKDGK